jgi:hypothetical protein
MVFEIIIIFYYNIMPTCEFCNNKRKWFKHGFVFSYSGIFCNHCLKLLLKFDEHCLNESCENKTCRFSNLYYEELCMSRDLMRKEEEDYHKQHKALIIENMLLKRIIKISKYII